MLPDGPILFVINSLLPGGAERSLVELLPRLSEKGIASIVCCLFRRELGYEDEVLRGGFDLRLLTGSNFASRFLNLRSMITSEQPALIHTTLFEADIIARLAAVGTGIPVMTTLANTTYDPARIDGDVNLRPSRVNALRLVDGFTARHMTSHFHAVSQAVKDSAVGALGLDPERVSVVHRGRDPKRLGMRTPQRRQAARLALGLGPETEMILTVGRQEFQKGHLDLLASFAALAATRPQTRLVFAGRPGNASDDLDAAVSRSGLGERITMLGHRDDIPDLFAAADVFVFPSLWEGLGGVLIEALALEVPIVASNIPAVNEVVVDGVNALLVTPGDVDALARAIGRLLEDPDEAGRLVEGNRRRFEEMFDLDRTSSEMIELLVGKARNGAG